MDDYQKIFNTDQIKIQYNSHHGIGTEEHQLWTAREAVYVYRETSDGWDIDRLIYIFCVHLSVNITNGWIPLLLR